MGVNCLEEIVGTAVVEEKYALSQSPQRSGTELIRTGSALVDAVGQARAHVVKGEVGIRVVDHVGHAGEDGWSGRERG